MTCPGEGCSQETELQILTCPGEPPLILWLKNDLSRRRVSTKDCKGYMPLQKYSMPLQLLDPGYGPDYRPNLCKTH